ncbi:hypothetical protein BKA57DRAFT_508410 [Linnemannia elongata]|nr:hypothetical protein BKA57DRAFT_508410 [Linnemannia elongata]
MTNVATATSLLLALLVSGTRSEIVRPTSVNTNSCGFYAGINYHLPSGVHRHCGLEIVAAGGRFDGTCEMSKNYFLGTARIQTPNCNKFINRHCYSSSVTGSSFFCMARAGERGSDDVVSNMLKDCYFDSSPRGATNYNIACEDGIVPNYSRFDQTFFLMQITLALVLSLDTIPILALGPRSHSYPSELHTGSGFGLGFHPLPRSGNNLCFC